MATATKGSEKKVEALREKIRHHEYRYYVLDDPEISDLQFDQLMNELKKIESDNPELVTPGLSHPARWWQTPRGIFQVAALFPHALAGQHIQRGRAPQLGATHA